MAKLFVLGASQGGVSALRTIVRSLPKDFPGCIAAVLHIGSSQSILPSILNDVRTLHAVHAKDGDALKPGCILIAPPDRHMQIADGHVELTRGPRENWARPAIDPLFRTAAAAYGPDAVGVILSGLLNDGTAGLYEIKRQGGIAIVQDPDEAEAPGMPENARNNVAVDYCLPLVEIAQLLNTLAREKKGEAFPVAKVRQYNTGMTNGIVTPIAQSCPECGGAMREERLGQITHYRCHIGHAFTAEVVAAAQTKAIENQLSAVLRALNERAALCGDMADKFQGSGDAEPAERWRHAANEARDHEESLSELVRMEWSHPEISPIEHVRSA